MKYPVVLAGALMATSAVASPLPSSLQAGGELVASTGFSAPRPLTVGPDSVSYRGYALDYQGDLHVSVDVSSLPDPTQSERFTPSLEVLINGAQRYFVDFPELYDSRDDQRVLSLGNNEIDWPFELRTQIDPAPGQVTVSAIVSAIVRSDTCCVIDSINAFAAGDLTLYFTDPPAAVPEPSSLLLLAGVLGLSGVALRRRSAA